MANQMPQDCIIKTIFNDELTNLCDQNEPLIVDVTIYIRDKDGSDNAKVVSIPIQSLMSLYDELKKVNNKQFERLQNI